MSNGGALGTITNPPASTSWWAQLPYAQNTPGIGIFYGDRVPQTAASLAYVQTALPSVPDTIDLADDLVNAGKYSGNTLTTTIRTLTSTGGALLDPQTQNLWVATTDNVLLTTVTAPFTDQYGLTTQLPLFYSQLLRFPIPVIGLSAAAQAEVAAGIVSNQRYYSDPTLAELTSLVTVTLESGSPIAGGHLWTVLPDAIDAAGMMTLRIFTNFKSTFRQRFVLHWNGYQETLNVHPNYFQSKSAASDFVYLASGIQDNSVGTLIKSGSASGNSTAQIVPSGGSGSTNQPRTASIQNTSNPRITAQSTSTPGSSTISMTSDQPYYVNGPTGYQTFTGSPTSYTTPSGITPPTTASTALTLNLTTLTCQNDSNGRSSIQVTLYNPQGIPVKIFPRASQPTTFTFFDPNAAAGIFTWSIAGVVDDSPGIASNVPQGTYSYTVTWAGGLGWYIPVATTYTNVPGASASYQTPVTTIAPSGTATQLGFALTTITAPVDSFGSTSYTVTLLNPVGTPINTWGAITSNRTLTYSATGALAGAYSWIVQAVVANTATGTSTYAAALSGIVSWYVAVPGAASLYINQAGTSATFTTSSITVAPTSVNTQLTLVLSVVTAQSDTYGGSSLRVQLLDPNGKIAKTWDTITAPQTFTYNNLAAAAGIWTWSIIAICTNLGIAVSSYTDTWTGTIHWNEIDPASTGHSNQSRFIGFTFISGTPDGTVYATTDTGPQIFTELPDTISSDENWYLRIHRGWLTYTDPSAHTYLVGLEPYYHQHFNGVIPLITRARAEASIITRTTIRVSETPILVDPQYPVDVIVSRRTPLGIVDTWVTRLNGLSTGVYDPTSLSDIDASKGTITLARTGVSADDTVHVAYTYLEYSYVYRGFGDAFGRFVHLDVNPAGGHTFMNLWNITSTSQLQSIVGSSTPQITSYQQNVQTPVQHSLTTQVSGTAAITQQTKVTTSQVLFSHLITQPNDTPTITQGTSQATASLVDQLTGSSIAAISATPHTTVIAALQTQGQHFAATISPLRSTLQGVNNTPQSKTVANSSNSTIIATTTSTLGRVDTGWITFSTGVQVTSASYTNDPAHPPYLSPSYLHTMQFLPNDPTTGNVTSTFTVDAPPVDAGSALIVSFQNVATTVTGGASDGSIVTTEYPWNQHDHTVGQPTTTNGGNEPGPTFSVSAAVVSPAGFETGYDHLTALGSSSFTVHDPSFTSTGAYKLQINGQCDGNGSSIWSDNLLLGNPVFVMTGQYKISGLRSITTTTYAPQNGPTSTYTTDPATLAPTTTGTALGLTLSSVVAQSNSAGTSSYNVQLTNPAGSIVFFQSGITSAANFTYTNATALAGSYQWKVWASVASNNNGGSSYTASATITYTWTNTVPTTTYRLSPLTGGEQRYPTGTGTLIPASSATALTCGITINTLGSDAYGSSELLVALYDPAGGLLQTWPVTTNQTLTYFTPLAANAGAYTWDVTAQALPASGAQVASTYSVDASLLFGWYQFTNTTTYTYSATPGLPLTYQTPASTLAPTSTAAAVTLNLTALTVPADTYGSSSLVVRLTDPNGNLVVNTGNIQAPQLFSYSDPGAVAGLYQWQVFASSTPTGNGVSSYPCTFVATAGCTYIKTTITYPPVSQSTSYTTSASTSAPTASATALAFTVNALSTTTTAQGQSFYQVSLVSPASATLQTWNVTAKQTLTYLNAAAAAGIYTWTVVATASAGGAAPVGVYPEALNATYSWYQQVTNSSTYYLEADGTTTTIPFVITNDPPSASASAVRLTTSAVSTTKDSNGVGSFTVSLLSPASAALQTWTGITGANVLVYSGSAAAATGTYSWQVTPTASNANTGAGSYPASLTARATYWELDPVNTTFYTAIPGASASYQTSPFTVAPQGSSSQLSATFATLFTSADRGGSSAVLVRLLDPTQAVVSTWTIAAPTTLTYSASAAISGSYTWTMQGLVTPTNLGTGLYPDQWGATLGYLASIDNEAPTVFLADRAIYLYLTVDGYPFHAVLQDLDDPTQPFAYDTNHAFAGTRYAAVPTIHGL